LLLVAIVALMSVLLVATGTHARPTLASAPAVARPESLTVEVEDDARVEEVRPEVNFGADSALRTDGGGDPDVRSYLRFAVEGVTDDVRRATLRLYATSETADGPAVYETETEWTEGELTWATRPSRTSDAIDDRRAIEADAWVEYDVTNFVTTDGVYAFVLAADGGEGVDFSAREGARPPELVLTLDGGRAEAERSDSAAAGESVTVVAAGDIACDPASGSFKDGLGTASNCRQEHTARLVEEIDPALVLGLGDMQYEEGTLDNYARSYDRSWGRFKDKTLVVAGGLHDFYGGGDFYEYWGERAGPAPLRNWFSRDAGAWHLVFLNSYCDEVGGCEPGDPQYEWLRADLAASDAACTLAMWHEPRFTSGARNGEDEDVDPLWDLLYEQGAELVLVGHEHNYERFAPMNGDGERDDASGVREFVVGTGGKSLGADWESIRPSSEVRQEEVYGVLRLTLRPDGYDWEFVAEPGQSFTDAGSGECHGAPDNGAVERDRSPLAATGLLQSITLHMASPTRRDDAALSFSSLSRRGAGRWDARAAGGRDSAVGRNHRRSLTRGTSEEQLRSPPRPALRGQAATAPAAATSRSQTRRGRRSADLSRSGIVAAASAAVPALERGPSHA
jgi:acid phosphatase type 7